MYNQGEIETKERRKVVFFAGATVAVILALIVAIVVVAMNKANRETESLVGNDLDKGSFSLESGEGEGESEDADIDLSGLIGAVSTKPANEDAEEPAAESTTTETVASAPASMPSTGPEDMLGIAVSLGGLTTAASALVMKKRG